MMAWLGAFLAGVMELMIASILTSSPVVDLEILQLLASADTRESSAAVGQRAHLADLHHWSRKSSSVNWLFRSFFSSSAAFFLIYRPPGPFRSGSAHPPFPGWWTPSDPDETASSCVSFSPTPMNLIGLSVTALMESAAPPRASPSVLVSTITADVQGLVERLGDVDRILAGHRIGHQQDVGRIDGLADRLASSSISAVRRCAAVRPYRAEAMSQPSSGRCDTGILADLDRIHVGSWTQRPEPTTARPVFVNWSMAAGR